MKLSCATWSFPTLTKEETVALAVTLGLSGVDQGLFFRGALDKQRLLSAPEAMGAEVSALGLPAPCYYHMFGPDLTVRNCADPYALQANQAEFERVVAFCEAASIETIFISPGRINPGQSHEHALNASARAIEKMAAQARRRAITLTIEPHVTSIAESPASVMRLLSLAEGLRLTLDYSHMVFLGHAQAEIDQLIPWAAHVHLRQARPGRLQERLELGTLNFAALLSALREGGYDGWLTLEYCHQPFMDMTNVDVLSETVKLRDLITRFFTAARERS